MNRQHVSTRFAAAAVALLVLTGVAGHDGRIAAKGHGHGNGQAAHAASHGGPTHGGPSHGADVAVERITFSPAPSGDPRQRTVTIHLSNQGDQPVGSFVVDLDAKRTGFVRSTQPSDPLSLEAGEQTDVSFVLGCKWLNGANNAEVTASTNPAPVPGETGGISNNRESIAPNLDFTGVDQCT